MSDSEDNLLLASVAQKAEVSRGSDSDEEMEAPAPRGKAAAKRRGGAVAATRASPRQTGARKRYVDGDNSDDDDDDDENDGGGAGQRGQDDVDSESDDDDADSDDDEKPTRRRRTTAKQAPPRKTPVKREGKPKAAPKRARSATPKKAPAVKSEATASSVSRKTKSTAGAAAPKRSKELKPLEQLDMAMKAFKWWEAPPLPRDERWAYIEHSGVYFSPEYTRHNVKMKYDGQEIELATSDQEEMATFYAGIAQDGPQLGNPRTADVFNRNFFRDFKTILGPSHVIQEFSKCDFGPIRAYLDAKKEEKKALTKDDKEKAKAEKEALTRKYGFAILDNNRIEKLGNTTIEPPGLFRGRGEHPKMGSLKQRVMPEDITINIARDAPVPKCPIPGHSWKKVVHDPTVTWLAYWRENVMGSFKYVFLAASSSFKGKADMAKYDKARRLCLNIDRIRSTYEKLLKSSDDLRVQQLATAIWIIDRLALRVGNEKDEDEADTVGCCSLRIEHIQFPAEDHVELNFLGKDSMPYHQVIDLSRFEGTGHQVYKNLRKFCDRKKPTEDVFDLITTTMLNKELTGYMPGLSAKVFRTFNASITLERELANLDIATAPQEKLVEYNRANREVAILCNHQRTVPKGFQEQFDKMQSKFETVKVQLVELDEMKAFVSKGKDVKLKSDTDDKDVKFQEAHLFAKQPTAAQVETRITQFRKKLRDMELTIKLKDDNKTVALGTSKINYMDPRITVAWCKKVELPIERVFAKTLRDKFPWAMSVPETWKFTPTGSGAAELHDEDVDAQEGGRGGGEEDEEDEDVPKRGRSASKKPSKRSKRDEDEDDEDEDDE